MKSTRRGFFGMVAGLFAAPNISILPWKQPEPLSATWISNHVLRTLQNQSEVDHALSGKTGEFFHPGKLKVGDTIMIRKPVRFMVQG